MTRLDSFSEANVGGEVELRGATSELGEGWNGGSGRRPWRLGFGRSSEPEKEQEREKKGGRGQVVAWFGQLQEVLLGVQGSSRRWRRR
jgi:hypothetical protein